MAFLSYLWKYLYYLNFPILQNDSSDDESKVLQQELTSMTDENTSLKKEVKQLKSDLDDSKRKYNRLVEFGEYLKAQVERKIEVKG